MATVVGGNQVRLDNGQTVTAQQGGWYDGQQFWGGSLSNRGQIHTQSNQQGAGQMVSREVVAQTNPNNVNYVFGGTNDVQNYLNELQNGIFSGSGGGDVPGVQSYDQIASDLRKSGLLPTTEAPKAPSMLDTYNKLAEEKGLSAIEKSIQDLTAQEDDLVAQTRINVSAERGKTVATNVIEGRVSEQTRQAQEQLDFIQRTKARKINEYNAATNNIKLIMDLTQQDFDNASRTYETQFSQAIATINLVQGIQQDQKTERQRAIDNARANLSIYTNAIINGNMDFRSLSASQKANLAKLEAQSGLPIGFTASLNPKKEIVFNVRNEQTGLVQIGERNPDGTISVKNIYTTPTASSSSGGGISLGNLWNITGGSSSKSSGGGISSLWP